MEDTTASRSALRDAIGAVSEGWVAGSAITRVDVHRDKHIVTIDAVLDDQGQPDLKAWRTAETLIAEYEADPAVTHYHVIARSSTASTIRVAAPCVPPLGWRTLWLRSVEDQETTPGKAVSPWLKSFLPLALKFAQSNLGLKLMSRQKAARSRKPPFVIEDAVFTVEAHPQDGTLTITDKTTGAVYAGLNRFVDGSDAGDEYNTCPLLADALYSPRVTGIKTIQTDACQSLEISLSLKTASRACPPRTNPGRKRPAPRCPSVPSRISPMAESV